MEPLLISIIRHYLVSNGHLPEAMADRAARAIFQEYCKRSRTEMRDPHE